MLRQQSNVVNHVLRTQGASLISIRTKGPVQKFFRLTHRHCFLQKLQRCIACTLLRILFTVVARSIHKFTTTPNINYLVRHAYRCK